MEAGLFKPSHGLFIGQAVVLFLLLVVGVTVLVTNDRFWVQMANAAFLAFAFGQGGFFMHDVGHGQVVNARSRRLVHVCLNTFLGWSTAWWVEKHGSHHAAPNRLGRDPDIAVGFVAFSKNQAEGKRGLCRFVVRYQHLFLPLLLFFEAWHLRVGAIMYLRKQATVQARTDLFLMALHALVYFGVLFYFLPVLFAAVFVLVHNGLLGLYLGMAFVPNHIGMPVVTADESLDYLRDQVITARNISGGWWVSALFGGLNFQIEHHLFSGMSRYRLRQAACIVEEFCRRKGIAYHSVSLSRSYREVFGYLREMARYAT